MTDFSEYKKIKEEIGENVSLMAVSKTKTTQDILPFLQEGHRLFGENRVEEAIEKWTFLKSEYPDTELHLIGHLQRNKIKEALTIFDSIDTLDNYDLADKIAARLSEQPENIKFMIEVNTGDEEQKSGIATKQADDFIDYCINNLKLNVTGLMCIPPKDEEPSPHFAFLGEIAKRHNLKELSMGMSADYMLAVQQGATMVRIGTLLFKRDL
jgi:pyridoxal phosphate enzyme (YggS family)